MPLPPLGPELLIHSSFDDTAVRRAHAAGHLVRLAPGRYVRTDVWTPLDDSAREILRIVAVVSRFGDDDVVCFDSAAVFWMFPALQTLGRRVHLIRPTLGQTRGSGAVTLHAAQLDDDETVEMHGVRVTSAPRTAADLARRAGFRQAVAALDHGLRKGLFTKDDVRSRLDLGQGKRGDGKADFALNFADPLANRAGESVSRCVMQENRFARPVLQHPFRGPRGQKAEVDFWWPEAGIVGEFDGEVKYRDRSMRGERSVEQVVIDEKDRENWIRAHPDVRGFVRWTWRDAVAPGRLTRLLLDAGVPHQKAPFDAWSAD